LQPEVHPILEAQAPAYAVTIGLSVWTKTLQSSLLFQIALVGLCLATTACVRSKKEGGGQDDEVQMGQEVFNELKAKGEIVESSPLYDSLRPIANAITSISQSQYNHPFKFYLVHEVQPNAFATPGGNVYVVDSLLFFVKNLEQLAGTLCHEVSHTIHHDTVTLMEKQEKIKEREVGAAVLLGPTRAHILAIALSASCIRSAIHAMRKNRQT
jgi:predicted Zn-dependent protease